MCDVAPPKGNEELYVQDRWIQYPRKVVRPPCALVYDALCLLCPVELLVGRVTGQRVAVAAPSFAFNQRARQTPIA